MAIILVRIGRIVTSFWFVFAVLVAIAASCFFRNASPGPSQLDASAREIRDPRFQKWYATVQTEQEKAGLRVSLDAYSRVYGSSVWARHVAEELGDDGKPRFFDLAELALSIENGEDRKAFADAHADAYALIVASGSTELASAYARHLAELRNAGGRDWRVAQTSPLAVAVHSATVGNPGLWSWYLDNRDWVDDYLVALHADPEAPDPEEGLAAVLDEFRRRPKVYRALRDEVAGRSDGKDEEPDVGEEEFLALASGTVSCYGDTFEVLCDAKVPFAEALDVLANNIEDLDFESPDACRETGVELANLYRFHRAVWDAAADLGGKGAVRFFREVPQHAETVLSMFGEANVLPFLMENYADSPELLVVASEVLEKHQTVGWGVLETLAGNDEFKRALLHPAIGHLVIPFAVNRAVRAGKDTSTDTAPLSEAVSACLDDPGWIKRELNPDGSFKPETVTLIETMPFIGGIVTVAKHQLRGEPVTMGEIGWAAFDVVDDVVTVAAIFATAGAATPAVAAKQAAKEAAKETAKTGGKAAVKQSGKVLVKQTTKKGGQYIAEKGGEKILRNGVEIATKRETRRTLVGRLALSAGRATSWTVRMAGKTVRIVASPVKKTITAWRKLSPVARRRILRASAAALFFVAVTARTLPKLPVAIQETLKQIGQTVGELVNGTVKGLADGFREAIKASLGFREIDPRLMNYAAGAVLLVLALLLLWRHRRQTARSPARLA